MKSVLRELSTSERIIDFETRECSIMDSRSVLFSSKFDLFKNIDVVMNGINEWKKLHHLLRACVLLDGETKKKYFAYASDSVLNSNENVKFLKFSVGNDDAGEDYWKILYENEIYKPYDHQNGLLWRLLFIEDKIRDGLCFYRVIFTAHHSIVDGRNHFCLIQQLLQIVERIYLSKPVGIESYEITGSIEDFVLTTSNENEQSGETDDAVLTSYKIPGYLRPNHTALGNQVSTGCEILTHDDKFYKNLDSIVEENSKISHSKFISFLVNENNFMKILQKCKQNGLKLTGYISTLIKIALTETHIHFSGNKNLQLTFRYFIAASARPNFKLDNYVMGNYATILYFENESIAWSEDKFWRHAKAESDELHLKLQKNNMAESLEEDKLFSKHVEEGFYFDEYEKEYCLSNLGDMTEYCSTEDGIFRIQEHYVIMSNRKMSTFNIFFNGIATLHNRLYWTTTYPSNLIKKEAAEFLMDTIQTLINKTIS